MNHIVNIYSGYTNSIIHAIAIINSSISHEIHNLRIEAICHFEIGNTLENDNRPDVFQ